MEIKEHFVIWNEPCQLAFYISETSLPFAKCMVENYTIEATSTGSRFTYAVGMQPRFPLSFLESAVTPKFFTTAAFSSSLNSFANSSFVQQ